MAAGEAGADYVLFGEPDASGQRPSLEAIAERLQWWAELFEPPCVGFAASREEISEFAAAGADFVLVGDFNLGRSARRGGGVAGCRAGDQTGADRDVRKSQSRNRNSAGNEDPASHTLLMSCLILTANAAAQVSLTPPGVDTPPAADKSAAKPKAKPPVQAKKPRLPLRQQSPRHLPRRRLRRQLPPLCQTIPMRIWCMAPISAAVTRRRSILRANAAQDFSDPKAMTMLGELYANAMGVKRDYAKAADWYKRAADGGDREACFALAMLQARRARRPGQSPRKPLNCLASSAKLGNPKAAYNLALLYLDGQDAAAGSQTLRGTASRRRRRRQSGSAIRPGDVLTKRAPAFRKTSTGGTAATGRVTRRHRPRSNTHRAL